MGNSQQNKAIQVRQRLVVVGRRRERKMLQGCRVRTGSGRPLCHGSRVRNEDGETIGSEKEKGRFMNRGKKGAMVLKLPRATTAHAQT
jgi:hypothetical protein